MKSQTFFIMVKGTITEATEAIKFRGFEYTAVVNHENLKRITARIRVSENQIPVVDAWMSEVKRDPFNPGITLEGNTLPPGTLIWKKVQL